MRESESSLTDSIAEQNRAIDSMLGEVSDLRQQQLAIEDELAEKQDELDAATKELEADKRHLAEVRARLQRALDVLRDRLVAIYESGSPDLLNVVLESASWSEVSTRAGYLSQIQDYDDSVAERVKGLRDEARAAVERMTAVRLQIKDARDAIAAKEREVAEARAAAAARFAELKEAQAARQAALEELESRSSALSNNLSAISEQMAATGAPAPASAPAPLTPGQSAEYISESQASVPASAPPEVQARDRSRQRDRDHPLHLGRRPRLLRIVGLRLLRSGQLRAARRRLPRKPARLDRPRDLGRSRRRPVDHRLRQLRPRLDDHRRPRLRHGRRPRPALAPGTGRLDRRLHRPPPARLLGGIARRPAGY